MDNYPKEHLDGVTPLVFAVNTEFQAKGGNDASGVTDDKMSTSTSTAFGLFCEYVDSKKVNKNNNNTVQASDGKKGQGTSPDNEGDPLSAALYEDSTKSGSASASTVGGSSASASVRVSSRMPFSKKTPASSSSGSSGNSDKSEPKFFDHARMVTVSTRHAFPPSKDPHGTQNSVSKLNNALYSTRRHKLMPSHNPYQQAAQNQQNNVQISSESAEVGQQNQMQQAEPSPITSILAKNPVQGILPEGWIEKHLHALPSVLVLVTTLDLTTSAFQQAQLEQYLAKVIESITTSSAKKRDCPIHIVCLVPKNPALHTPKEVAMEAERLNSIRSMCRLNNNSVTSVHHFPNKKGETIFVKEDFRKFEQSLHDDSSLYYLTQVRRCKRKHSLLRHDKFVDLLPFAARYCIKIAIFYEFQGWNDSDRRLKSVKYWKEAYRNLQDYYLYLQGDSVRLSGSLGKISSDSQNLLRAPNSSSSSSFDGQSQIRATMGTGQETSEKGESGAGERDRDSTLSNNSSTSPPPPPTGSPSQGDGVEVALVGSPRSGGAVAIGAKSPKPKPRIDKTIEDVSVSSSKDKDTNVIASATDEEAKMMTYSRDMIHQCRAVADLLNIKLIVTCYNYATRLFTMPLSGDEQSSDGDITFDDMAKQIKTHAQVFLSKPRSLQFSRHSSVSDIKAVDSAWYFLEFVVHQRLVLAQFLERQPIPSKNVMELSAESLSYCDPSQHYMAYAEVLIRLGLAVNNEINMKQGSEMNDGFAERQRFVGGLGSQDFVSDFKKAKSIDHKALAMQNFSKAIEITKNKKASTGYVAKAHFMIADILAKRGKYTEALEHLKNARGLVLKIPSLRVAIDTAITKCLANTPSTNNGSGKISVPLMMDCGVNSILSKVAINHLQKGISSNSNGMTPLNWQYDSESTQPFSFSLTFPAHLYATEGDTVPVTLLLHSNLPFVATVNSFQILTNVGEVTITGDESRNILPKQTLRIPARLYIPNGCMKNIDVKFLEKQSIKGQKPNTFGLTRVGGGVYTSKASEEKLAGGLCVSCLTLGLTLSIRYEGHTSIIPLKLHNNHRGSFPRPDSKEIGIRRSLVEEDNFVFSSWSRPEVFPMSGGPRCLRVLRAQSDLKITDLTSNATGGKVMEGTVNRILLSLKSGSMEQCKDVKIRVSCSSWVELEGSEPTSLLDQTDANKMIPTRLPCIVQASSSAVNSVGQKEVIPGWVTVAKSDDEGRYHSEWIDVSDMIDSDAEIISFFDLYRPLVQVEDGIDHRCKTKFTAIVSYQQIRLDQSNHGAERDSVTQTYEGTVEWCAPLSTEFKILPGNDVSFPSGSRHPTNFVGSNSNISDRNAVISGNSVGMTCSLLSPGAECGLAVEVCEVKFMSRTSGRQPSCDLSLVSRKAGTPDPNTLYTPKPSTFCNKLTSGTKLKVAFTVRPQIKQEGLSESVQVTSTHLGIISTHFVPIPLYNDAYVTSGTGDLLGYYGPLPIRNLPLSNHRGPLSYVETTPFDASFETIPSLPQVAHPFEVKYKVTNKTKLHQKLKVSMTETEGTASGMLVSGIINGELNLGPMESTAISYSMMVTKIGKTILPDLSVSSLRYNTWVIHGIKQGTIYVMP